MDKLSKNSQKRRWGKAALLAVSLLLGMLEAVSGVYLPLSLVPAVVYAVLMIVMVAMMARAHRTGSLISLGEKDVL